MPTAKLKKTMAEKRSVHDQSLAISLVRPDDLWHGFVTTAAERDVELTRIMDATRHKDVRTVTGYVHRANLLKGHAGASFLCAGPAAQKLAGLASKRYAAQRPWRRHLPEREDARKRAQATVDAARDQYTGPAHKSGGARNILVRVSSETWEALETIAQGRTLEVLIAEAIEYYVSKNSTPPPPA
jgi:hypothetical protein